MTFPVPGDEGRHPSSDHPLWEEAWHLDFATPDGTLGGHLRLVILPNQGVSWVWTALVGKGRRLVTVVEHEAPVPRRGSLDLRCEGLWMDLVCEDPLEHWSVGLEAFGVALDEPADAYRGLRGERIGLGLDLGWETVGAPWGGPGGDRYELACDVSGEVLLGEEVLTFDGWGNRSHTWGVGDWWTGPWTAAAGRLDDGTRWRWDDRTGADGGLGRTVHDDGAGRRDGLPSRVDLSLGDLELRNDVFHLSPVPLEAPDGRQARAVHALCRTTTSDGRAGTAWLTLNRPV